MHGTLVHRDYAVYFAQSGGLTKVGYSGNLGPRTDNLGRHEGAPVRVVALVYAPSRLVAQRLEKKMHQRFAAKKDHGEWFDLSRQEILDALTACRSLGLKTGGMQDATSDMRVSGSMKWADRQGSGVVVGDRG